MASSRLERIGTIYSRVQGLIRSGAVKYEDRPLWYDLYEAFPPKEKPSYDRPAPNMKIKRIFYNEDKIRAIFHRNNKYIGSNNMFNNYYKSLTQKFIESYKELEKKYEGNESEEKLYLETIELLKMEKDVKNESQDEDVALSVAFKRAQSQQKDLNQKKVNINVTNIFKV